MKTAGTASLLISLPTILSGSWCYALAAAAHPINKKATAHWRWLFYGREGT
ncbi:MAG: hypothetical protein KJ063_02135 [Anaerolineae bacterium]|nr:hypothetical protein [Anaerolineae bacterium]